jgi:hypothetical protein
VHVKDFKLDRKESKYSWTNLGEGDVDWPAVRAALADAKYEGWVTAEISGGDAVYLKDVVARLDRIFAGQKPIGAPASLTTVVGTRGKGQGLGRVEISFLPPNGVEPLRPLAS